MNKWDERQIAEIKRQYGLLKNDLMSEREHREMNSTLREPFQRDFTRVLYSSAFRRLQGKMQVLGVQSTAFFRNRLTHSLEVVQLARSMASSIVKNCKEPSMYQNDEMYLLEAAALAHDIGHPAFGHKGERVLDEIAKSHNLRFEGNAQNFKVLRKLEKKEPEITGLNLTNRTLLAINKYLVVESDKVKKFMYADDYGYLQRIRRRANLENIRTLDVQIIDLADEIAYAVHDLEDALALRYFTIDELLYEMKKDKDVHKLLLEIVDEGKTYANKSLSYGTIQEYSQVFRKRLTSCLTHLFVNDITLSRLDKKTAEKYGTSEGQYELSLGKYKQLSINLRDTIFECINRDADVTLYEQRGEVVIKSLFNLFSDEKVNKEGKLLTPDYRPREGYSLIQGSIDYIAGMMDTFAIAEYERLMGIKFSDIRIDSLSTGQNGLKIM